MRIECVFPCVLSLCSPVLSVCSPCHEQVGSPIPVEKDENPSDEVIAELHTRFAH